MNITNCNGVQIGQNVTINISKKDTQTGLKQRQTVVKTKEIDILFACTDPVTREHLNFISSHIGEGWKDVGRNLKFSDGQIFQFEKNYLVDGIKEVCTTNCMHYLSKQKPLLYFRLFTNFFWIGFKMIQIVQLLED